MKQLSGIRKADSRLGDDTTYTRWVRVPGHRHREDKRPPAQMPASATTTKFPTRILQVDQMSNLLVSGRSNIKIGRDVRVGKLKGYWLYTLSLTERATCPTACAHWRDCYGNNMPFAKRIDHTDPRFIPALIGNVDRLLEVRNRPGIIVRLHALGDFYSLEYVAVWEMLLIAHPNLVIYGYTAWLPDTPIGTEIARMIDTFPGRAMMRFSNGDMRDRCAIPIETAADCPPGAFVCPDQTEQFDGCGKCGACFYSLKNVAFADH